MTSFSISYEDQSKILDDALQVVKVQTYQMRRCLESNKLMDGLKHCSTMLAELRTSALTPKNYYELYMAIFDSMRHMTDFLKDAHLTERHHLADLYELVQYAGNIIPRLYLMITVGSVYMAMEDAPVREIMRDMLEMSRGVQHPIRGLFLRYYLGQMTKDHLPVLRPEGESMTSPLDDVDGPSAGDGIAQGTLRDSVHFILTNFVEMNKLWVRLQHQGHSRDREKREMERRELRTLVGSNFIRLSQLEGVDLPLYSNVILPKILEQVVNCRDVIAQEYLMEAIIQVFEDNFHLRTLTTLLSATAQLNPKVSVKSIVIALLDRIAAYAAREAESQPAPSEDTELLTDEDSATVRGIPADIQLFEVFWKEIVQLIHARPDISMEDITALCLSLTKLSLNCYPERYDYIDQILAFISDRAEQSKLTPDFHAPSTINNLLALMQEPLHVYPTVLHLLRLDHYNTLLGLLTFSTRRTVARVLVAKLLQQETVVSTKDEALGLLGYCSVLIKSPKAASTTGVASPRFTDRRNPGTNSRIPSSGLLSDEDYAEDQGLLARLVHLFQLEDCEDQYVLLNEVRRLFADGGDFVCYTFPPLITQALQLIRRLYQAPETHSHPDGWETMASRIFKYVHQVIVTLNDRVERLGGAETALRLFLLAGQSADEYGFEEVAYEFFVQAFTVYEENISESRAQCQALTLITSGLYASQSFGEDNYDTLARKCILHASKLLKRPDQCRAMYACSHLFWRVLSPDDPRLQHVETLHRNGQRVLETLQRAVKIADACLDSVTNVELLVEILDQYTYFFEYQTDHIQAHYISGLVHLIHTNITNVEAFVGERNAGDSMTASSAMVQPKGSITDYVVQYFQRILQHLEQRKRHGPARAQVSALIATESPHPTNTADSTHPPGPQHGGEQEGETGHSSLGLNIDGLDEANPFANPDSAEPSPLLSQPQRPSGGALHFPDYSQIDISADF
ncbi:retromer complex subunit Vps35 [Dispira simplex]|nr:retromer complex subunit Vps35 [Dispira simplex]